jgi:hypothetical protein
MPGKDKHTPNSSTPKPDFPRGKLPDDLQKIVDDEETLMERIYEGKYAYYYRSLRTEGGGDCIAC